MPIYSLSLSELNLKFKHVPVYVYVDIPPLEDMSEYLIKLGLSAPSKPSAVKESIGESNLESSKEHTPAASGNSHTTDVQGFQSPKDISSKAKKSPESDVFGGFKKGFLLSAPASKSTSSGAAKANGKSQAGSEPPAKEPHDATKADPQLPVSSKVATSSSAKVKRTKKSHKKVPSEDVPFVRAQRGAEKQDGLVLEEVQDALKKDTQHLMKDTGKYSVIMSKGLCI